MSTSCGSPFYAAPEVIISDGMCVGPAVDVWSGGVLLYVMLAGYLPFDDDPTNPNGDNINLLHKYIVNTPLSFPDFISTEARDLLSLMLVPDPKNRSDIQTVMNHHWLRPGASLFNRTLVELEHVAIEQHQQKRLAYQRQMKAAATAAENQRTIRSQSARAEGYVNSVGVPPIDDGVLDGNTSKRWDSMPKDNATPTSISKATNAINDTPNASNTGASGLGADPGAIHNQRSSPTTDTNRLQPVKILPRVAALF
jgi:serine/threonine protein kinase